MINVPQYSVRVKYVDETKLKSSYLPICDREGNVLVFDTVEAAKKEGSPFGDYIIDKVIDGGIY